jgi:hypothetical protein
MMQAAAFSPLITRRQISDYRYPDCWVVVPNTIGDQGLFAQQLMEKIADPGINAEDALNSSLLDPTQCHRLQVAPSTTMTPNASALSHRSVVEHSVVSASPITSTADTMNEPDLIRLVRAPKSERLCHDNQEPVSSEETITTATMTAAAAYAHPAGDGDVSSHSVDTPPHSSAMDETGSMDFEEDAQLTPEEGYLPKKEGERMSLLVGPVKHQGISVRRAHTHSLTSSLPLNCSRRLFPSSSLVVFVLEQ